MDNISRFQKTTGVGQILDESFARCPEREAIVFGDWRITYRELQALIYRTAHCLRSLGIAPGDRVAIISRNCPEVMIAEIAILKLGGTVVKFNWRLAPEEMTYLLDLNEVRCAFFKPEREDWGDALRQHYAGRITFLSLTPEADGRSALYSLLAGMLLAGRRTTTWRSSATSGMSPATFRKLIFPCWRLYFASSKKAAFISAMSGSFLLRRAQSATYFAARPRMMVSASPMTFSTMSLVLGRSVMRCAHSPAPAMACSTSPL